MCESGVIHGSTRGIATTGGFAHGAGAARATLIECYRTLAGAQKMIELNREIRDLYMAYARRKLKPESALEIASDFVLDLINAFGDTLDGQTPLKDGWRMFAPFE